MRSLTFVVNPNAGKGKGATVAARVEAALLKRGMAKPVFCYTKEMGDATALARTAQTNVVVAIGGDGTVNEVANGLEGTGKTLGIIPAGSGNDLIKSLGIPKNTEASLEVLLQGNIRPIDVGRVTCFSGEEIPPQRNATGRLFVNGVGVGFDAEVAARIAGIPVLRGTFLYLAAVLQTLGSYRAPEFTISMNGTPFKARELLVAIGNGKCAGGGFYLTPDASPDDGLLDICAVDDRSVAEIFLLMPKVMRGKHTEKNKLRFFKTNKIALSSESPFYVHADGEIVGRKVHAVEVALTRSRLPVIAGASSD